jgi:hypothetical protein
VNELSATECGECGYQRPAAAQSAPGKARPAAPTWRGRPTVDWGLATAALGTAAKAVGVVVGVLLSVIALLVGGVIIYVQCEDKDHEARQQAKREEKDNVRISADIDTRKCGHPTYPVRVVVTNHTANRTVKALDFYLGTFIEGDSRDLGAYSVLRWTTIVRPGQVRDECYRAPVELGDFQGRRVFFRPKKHEVYFYDDDEFIPE